MAANIEFNKRTNRHSFVSKKELAWHKLGTIVEAMTSEEAIVLGGLDFEVGLEPIYTVGQRLDVNEVKNFDNVIKNRPNKLSKVEYYERTTIPNKYATVRLDNHFPLGVVGGRYTPIQNKEAFNFFDSAIGEGHAQYETAGVLGNGETVFITAKLPNYIQIPQEHIDNYLLFTMAHDGTGSVMVIFTPIRVVCNNTLSLAIGRATNRVIIRHTKSAKEKLENLDKVLGMTNTLKDNMNNSFKILQDIIIPDNIIEDLMIDCLGLKVLEDKGVLSTKSDNILQEAINYYQFGFGQKDFQNTAWGILNGVTGYLQNIKSFRSDENMFNSMFLKNGSTDGAGIRQKTFDLLIKMKPKIYSLSNVSN